MTQDDNVIARNRAARQAIKGPSKPLDDKAKALVLAMTKQGATLFDLAERDGIGGIGRIWATYEADPAFEADMRKAAPKGAATLLAEAHRFVADAAMSGDQDKVRAADMYMRCTQAFVEKIAPREFGQLMKLAGDADQAAVTVHVIKFSDAKAETGDNTP